jgi:putative phage-type endonuclease
MTTALAQQTDTEKYTNRRDWLMARRTGLFATDGAAIWGASSWQSPYAVCFHKIGPLDIDQPDIMQRVGKALEPLVGELFTESTGIEVHDPGDFTIFRRKDIPILGCTPDRITNDGSAVVELKTAHFAAADEWKSHIPVAYQIQLSHQMIVLGVRQAFIAVLINSTTLKHHRMQLSDRFAKRHIAKCVGFWRQYVEPGIYPPPDYSSATSRTLALSCQRRVRTTAKDSTSSLVSPPRLKIGGMKSPTESRQRWARTNWRSWSTAPDSSGQGRMASGVLPESNGRSIVANSLSVPNGQSASRALVRAGDRGLLLTSIDDMWRFAEAVSRAGLAPRGLNKPEQVLVALGRRDACRGSSQRTPGGHPRGRRWKPCPA